MNSQAWNLLFNFFTIGIPECTALTMLMLALLRKQFIWKKILLTAVLLAAGVLACRLVVQSIGVPGIHTAMATLLLALLVAYFFHVPKHKALAASVFCLVFLLSCEVVVYKLFNQLFALNIKELAQNRLYWLVNGWLPIAAIALAAVVITRTGWYTGKTKQ